ncbi:Tubulin-specific chaperone D [Oopsacas minuta]|uniref:Tubulin-specific chaperone D n=1 Tax=Oopsacas minuta TaxID=111878 RepID=A0AAV7KHC0_9METZ|nr:Tubulin-specific chaperone D [Oopsacas minuta]
MHVLVALSQQVIKQQINLFQEDWCIDMLCGLIKQANERIDRVRLTASSSIITLIHKSAIDIPYIPHINELRKIFPQDPTQLINPSESFSITVKAIKLDTYRKSVLSGLVISIGGVSESVIRAASSSLLEQIKEVSQDQELLDRFTVSLTEVYNDCIKQPRLLVPFLKLTDSLLTNACFEEYRGDPGSFPDQLFTYTQSCTKKTKDVKRVLASIDVFCGLLQFQGQVQTKVLSHMMDLLCHPIFPRARKIAAEQLYLTLITYEELMSPDVVDEVNQILSDTLWNILEDRDLTQPRDRLCELFNLPIPAPRTPANVKESGIQKPQDFTFNEFVQRPF